jgi:exopolysaccharide production protein ExoZ
LVTDLPPPAKALKQQVESIQFLRFFAAFIVVVYHAELALKVYDLSGFSYVDLTDFFAIGQSGVHIFFVISGFVMIYTTKGMDRGYRSVVIFLYRRFARIYPIYWICCILYLLFHATLLKNSNMDAVSIVKALALWPGYSSGIIGPGWTLSYEIYFYICFSLTLFFPVVPALIAMTIAMSAIVVLGAVFELRGTELHVLTNPLLLEFLLGAWIAMVDPSRYRISKRLPDLMIGAALVMFLVPAGFDAQDVPSVLSLGVPSALIVLGLVLLERQGRLPNWVRSWSNQGNGSYSLYLLHNLVIDLVLTGLVALGAVAAFGWLWGIAAIVASCIASNYVHLWLEKPVHRYLAGLQLRPAPTTGFRAGRD